MSARGDQPAAFRLWVAGARPRTLTAAIAPVAVGTGAAVGGGDGTSWWRAGLALVVAVALQVGVNYANDYSDGVRGTDDSARIGPLRLVGSGLVAAPVVKRAATISFAIAGGAGVVLAAVAGWELLVVGALCLVAGWTYTGGPRPYGYLGFGEFFVFVFFGLVATAGTTYVLLERIHGVAVLGGVSVGLWAVALLVVNNLRDIPGDAAVGKHTLAVRLGDPATRRLFSIVLIASYAVAIVASVGGRAAAAAVVGAPLAAGAVRTVAAGADGVALIPVLGATGRAQLVSALAMAVGLALTG